MGTRAKGAALGAGLAVLALLALPPSPSLAEQTQTSNDHAKSSGSAKKGSPQTQPAQTRPARSTPAKGAAPARQTATTRQPTPARPGAPAKPTAPARQTAPASAKGKQKPLVFTDDDLKKYHSGEEATPPRKPSAQSASSDPLKPFKDKAEKDRWRQSRVAEFQKNIMDLEGRLKFLQQKRLSIQNPLMPRPSDGSEAPDTDEGLSGEERLAKNDEEIRDTTVKLEAARKELATFLEANPE